MSSPGPTVVAIGGGHGLSVVLRAVAPWASRVTAVVSTADDGGSTGRLRAAWEVPAVGDARRCLAALGGDGLWARILEHRFDAGDLRGHALGNLLLLALIEELGDLQGACDELARTAGIDLDRARIVPVTDEAVELQARTAEGQVVTGQVTVAATTGVESVWVDPASTVASTLALQAVAEADLVVLGPGSLYTSVLAAAVVGDVRKALADATGRVVYVGNLRADGAETSGYDQAAHVAALRRHGIHPGLLVTARGALETGDPGLPIVEADLATADGSAHDPARLGAVLAGVAGRRGPDWHGPG